MTVAKMRRHRMWMVQTADQYFCIHSAIHEIFKRDRFTKADDRIDKMPQDDESSSVSVIPTNLTSSKDPLQCLAENMPVIAFDNFGDFMALDNVSKTLEKEWNTINNASKSFGGEYKAATSDINLPKNRSGISKIKSRIKLIKAFVL